MLIKMTKKLFFIKEIKSNRASEILTTPIIIAIGIMMVSSLLLFCVKLLTPYIWYEKMSSTCLKYVFIMEEYGYLTNVEKNNLINDLEKAGFDKKDLKISYTSRRQGYGMPIYLRINYIYKLHLPVVGEKLIPMNINRESVSKR